MTNVPQSNSVDQDRQWFIVGQWQAYEGEARANTLRILAIGTFYIVELINYYGLQLGFLEMPKMVDKPFHQTVTALAALWIMVCLGVLFCLSQRIFPAGLKYLTTGIDIILLTAILVVAHGPRSPLVIGYFLIVILATLRFSLPLVRAATIGSLAAYLVLLGYAAWFTERDLRVPRYHQAMFLLGLALSGIVLGQVIRRVRGMAAEYAGRLSNTKAPLS